MVISKQDDMRLSLIRVRVIRKPHQGPFLFISGDAGPAFAIIIDGNATRLPVFGITQLVYQLCTSPSSSTTTPLRLMWPHCLRQRCAAARLSIILVTIFHPNSRIALGNFQYSLAPVNLFFELASKVVAAALLCSAAITALAIRLQLAQQGRVRLRQRRVSLFYRHHRGHEFYFHGPATGQVRAPPGRRDFPYCFLSKLLDAGPIVRSLVRMRITCSASMERSRAISVSDSPSSFSQSMTSARESKNLLHALTFGFIRMMRFFSPPTSHVVTADHRSVAIHRAATRSQV